MLFVSISSLFRVPLHHNRDGIGIVHLCKLRHGEGESLAGHHAGSREWGAEKLELTRAFFYCSFFLVPGGCLAPLWASVKAVNLRKPLPVSGAEVKNVNCDAHQGDKDSHASRGRHSFASTFRPTAPLDKEGLSLVKVSLSWQTPHPGSIRKEAPQKSQ